MIRLHDHLSPRRLAGAFALGAAVLLSAPGSSQAQVLSADWDFDDGTLQGWTTVSGDVTQQVFAPMTHGPLFGSAPGPQAGTHVVGVNMGYDPPIDSPWDAAHETMWLRSPEFLITGTTEVSFYLTGVPGIPLD